MKIKIIGILVCMLLIAATVLSVGKTTNVINVKNNGEDEDSDTSDRAPKFTLFPNIPRLFNRDWNFWSNKPHLYSRSTGNVGIGTENPAEKLDVVGTVQMTGFKMPTNANNGYVLTSDASGVGTWQAGSGSGISGSGSTNTIPKFTGSTTLGDSVVYENNGNIGIGATNPDSKLHVEGDLTVSGAYKGDIGPNNGAPFPRPAYDSGWVPLELGGVKLLTHNIGGNVDNYVVDLLFKDTDDVFGINHIAYGGRPFGGGWQCGEWHNLTSSTIIIARVRIWVYN